MSKIKQALEEMDYLKAKRLIMDNPKYLEENVDLLIWMIKELSKTIRFSSEVRSKNRKDSLDKKMLGEMKHGPMAPNQWQRASTWHDKDRAHGEAINENDEHDRPYYFPKVSEEFKKQLRDSLMGDDKLEKIKEPQDKPPAVFKWGATYEEAIKENAGKEFPTGYSKWYIESLKEAIESIKEGTKYKSLKK